LSKPSLSRLGPYQICVHVNQITQSCKRIPEKLSGPQVLKKFLTFYGTRKLITYSQQPATCPNPEPDRSSPYPHPRSLRFSLLLSYHLRLGLPRGLHPLGFPTKTLYAHLLSPIRATYPAHLSVLDLIIQIIFVEEYRAESFLLCSLLHSPVTSSLLGPNIVLISLFLCHCYSS
jgi:hypothetical protein